MPSIRITALAGLAALGSLASAATEVKLLNGVCGQFPGGMQSGTGNTFVGEVNLKPLTGTYIDNLEIRYGQISTVQRGSYPWYTLALYNETGYAITPISCSDEEGLQFRASPLQPLRINTDQEGTLVLQGYGLLPEAYAYYVDGKRQPGVYIGAAGEVRWAWSQVTDSKGIVYWKPRLLVATDGYIQNSGQLKDGEIGGFLVVN